MLGRNDLTHYLLESKAITASMQYAKGRNHCRNNTNDSFDKGLSYEVTHHHPHLIKYARGGAVELYGRRFSRYFSELGSI